MKDFDAKIRERLANHTAERPADAWDRFVRHVPAREYADNSAFDAFLRQKLAQHQVRHTTAIRQRRWAGLQRSLDRLRDRSRELWLARSLEALVLLLICFHWGLPTQEVPVESEPLPQASEPMARQFGPESGAIVHAEPSGALPPGTTSVAQPAPAASPGRGVTQVAGLAAREVLPLSPTAPIPTEHAHAVEGPSPERSGWAQADEASSMHRAESLFAIPLLPKREMAPDLALQTDLPGREQLFRPRRRYHHRVSMAMQTDLHAVMTPYDHLLVKRGYDQWSAGFGAAMGYSWEGRRWGLRAQLTYRHLYYLPKPYVEVFDGDMQRGYFTESIRNIELNMASIGLQVSRHVSTTGRWRWYALTGGSMHIAVLANYDRKQSHIPGIDPVNPGEWPTPQQSSLTSEKRFADGFFEGGNLEENYYLSLDIGGGVERHLGGRISLFAEPVYHHNPFQKSLGPNRDRISTLSLFTGLRVLL